MLSLYIDSTISYLNFEKPSSCMLQPHLIFFQTELHIELHISIKALPYSFSTCRWIKPNCHFLLLYYPYPSSLFPKSSTTSPLELHFLFQTKHHNHQLHRSPIFIVLQLTQHNSNNRASLGLDSKPHSLHHSAHGFHYNCVFLLL